MKLIPATAFLLLLSLFVYSQAASRPQKIQQIDELNARIKTLKDEILLPSSADLKQAKSEGFEVFRLMPREKYDHKLTVDGGGSYYSFTTRSHDYQKIAQIGLEQNFLKVGFAGADFGFISDLGEIALGEVTDDTPEVGFLVAYKPPQLEKAVRMEAMRAYNYDANGFVYKSRISAIPGHVYVLRAISFDHADVLVSFRISRMDTDGSIIIQWKMLENFDKPTFERDRTAIN